MAVGLVVVALGTLSCARRPEPGVEPLLARLARADAAVGAGCYACLEEAERLFATALTDRRFGPAAREGRLKALLLLSARARELGLPDTSWESEAACSVEASPDPLWAVRLDVVRRIHRPEAAASPQVLEAERAAARVELERLSDDVRATLLPRATHDIVDAYLVLALSCMRIGVNLEPPPLPPAIADEPLIAFRTGTCSVTEVDRVEHAIAVEPRFVEARARLGEVALHEGRLVSADRELRAALEGYPDLGMAALTLGTVSLLLEDPLEALASFDRVLTRVHDQPQALMGRIRALTALGRAAEAIETADRLLEQGTWHQGDAHYFRAWNLRQLGRIEEAAAAVAEAHTLLFNAAVPKLAGFIAWDLGRFDEARSELETSLERNGSDCEVLFALGQVHGREQAWATSAGFFVRAADCSAGAQEALRSRLAEIRESDLDATRQARLTTRAERDLAAAARHEGLSAIEAAEAFRSAGRPRDACAPAERALRWEAHRKRALQILTGLHR